MVTFDDVIGYGKEKAALYQICDVLKNEEKYAKLGAKCPKGMVLIGPPGVGKTLMADAVINEIGRKCFVCRREASDGDFIEKINETFCKAEEEQPSVILLDDLDKFTEQTRRYRDAEEHIAVQTCIDEMEGDVFVVATVNNNGKIPRSLLRPGRLEEHVFVGYPTYSDAKEIIAHYLDGKKVSADVSSDEIAALMWHNSCAGLEVALNEAAIYSANEGLDVISRDDLVKSLLHSCYGVETDGEFMSDDERKKAAYYVAGQVVAFYKFYKNALAFATVCRSRRGQGARGCVELSRSAASEACWADSYRHDVCWLAGKAAYERKFEVLDEEAGRDISNAADDAEYSAECGEFGFRYSTVKINREPDVLAANFLNDRIKKANSEAQKAVDEAKDLVADNWKIVEKVAQALEERLIMTGAEIEELLNEQEGGTI